MARTKISVNAAEAALLALFKERKKKILHDVYREAAKELEKKLEEAAADVTLRVAMLHDSHMPFSTLLVELEPSDEPR